MSIVAVSNALVGLDQYFHRHSRVVLAKGSFPCHQHWALSTSRVIARRPRLLAVTHRLRTLGQRTTTSHGTDLGTCYLRKSFVAVDTDLERSTAVLYDEALERKPAS